MEERLPSELAACIPGNATVNAVNCRTAIWCPTQSFCAGLFLWALQKCDMYIKYTEHLGN